jgi:hypothetical protein
MKRSICPDSVFLFRVIRVLRGFLNFLTTEHTKHTEKDYGQLMFMVPPRRYSVAIEDPLSERVIGCALVVQRIRPDSFCFFRVFRVIRGVLNPFEPRSTRITRIMTVIPMSFISVA